MRNGADINFCEKDEAGPLYLACQDGHNSTVELLLSIGADFTLCMNDGARHVYIACHSLSKRKT